MKKLTYNEFYAFESPIDTDYFGIMSAKVVLKEACSTVHRQNELLSFLQDFNFITIINKANDPVNNRWLGERTKAFLTDINMQLMKKVSVAEKYNDSFTVISNNLPEDHRIIQIAETSFTYSRFLNDPYLPVEKARCIYGDITRNAFLKDDRFFVVSKKRDVIKGFLLFSLNASTSSSLIELIAVDKNYEGCGIGLSLIRSMEHFVSRNGVDKIKVGTQLSNINALNFYTSNGFLFIGCNSIYHYWPFKS